MINWVKGKGLGKYFPQQSVDIDPEKLMYTLYKDKISIMNSGFDSKQTFTLSTGYFGDHMSFQTSSIIISIFVISPMIWFKIGLQRLFVKNLLDIGVKIGHMQPKIYTHSTNQKFTSARSAL